MSSCCTPEVTSCCSSNQTPERLKFGLFDYIMTIISWFNAFRRTFSVKPGLYYIGKSYDVTAPMLVTCNYHMTVFLLYRILKRRNVRILVIDTKGINVWCSSGKGQFNAAEIMKVLNAYSPEHINKGGKLEIILPKLSLSGVKLSELRKNLIVPKIGPVYAHDIPAYLDEMPLQNRDTDRFNFTLKDRLFTAVPSLTQFLMYTVPPALVLGILNYFLGTGFYLETVIIPFIFGLLFILFFPVLPTKTFSIKGIVLSINIIAAIGVFKLAVKAPIFTIDSGITALITLSYGMFFALYYTGNSGVSNYSRVKKEIVTYLPVTFFLFLITIVLFVIRSFMVMSA